MTSFEPTHSNYTIIDLKEVDIENTKALRTLVDIARLADQKR